VGSPKELGVWNAAESTCSLSWSEGDVWVGELPIAPGPVEFKLVQVSDHEVIWPAGNNVSLLIPDQASGVDVTGEGESLNLTILGGQSPSGAQASGGQPTPSTPSTPASTPASTPSTEGRGFFDTVEQKVMVEFETLELGRLEDMKVAELKSLLKQRGLPVSGKKAELIERLASAGN
jgi:hypothetical protein